MWWDERSPQELRPTWWRPWEAKRDQVGWGWWGAENEGTEEGKVGREHRQLGTTIVAAHTRRHFPLYARHPTKFICSTVSVINLQFAHTCTVPDMVLLWGSFNPRWKHLETSGQKEPSICTLTSFLPLGVALFSIIGFRQDGRNWNREEMAIVPFNAENRCN